MPSPQTICIQRLQMNLLTIFLLIEIIVSQRHAGFFHASNSFINCYYDYEARLAFCVAFLL